MSDETKICVACGMPMESADDFPGGDTTTDYCVHCARPDGSMQSYNEKLDGLSAFLVRTQKLDASTARQQAIELMAQLPAWEGQTFCD